jgi:DNA-binding transcriptional ArsR family regulator
LSVASDRVRRVSIDVTATELRRRLGPTSWVVFEELLLASSGSSPRVASVSVRALAASLGLSKDTVARALVRLRRAGLVTAHQARTTSGLFATGTYRLMIPESISVSTRRAPAASSSRRVDDVQLELAIES